jgi:hypothetical protein
MQFLACRAHIVPGCSICDEWEDQVGYQVWGYNLGDLGFGPRSLDKFVSEIAESEDNGKERSWTDWNLLSKDHRVANEPGLRVFAGLAPGFLGIRILIKLFFCTLYHGNEKKP